jgi:anti-sigma B factor antagonist
MMVTAHAIADATIVITVAGEIDMETVPDLDVALTEAVHTAGVTRLIVDFGQVTFCDSTGIAALDSAYDTARHRGIAMQLRNPQPNVCRVLEIVGLLDRLLTGD